MWSLEKKIIAIRRGNDSEYVRLCINLKNSIVHFIGSRVHLARDTENHRHYLYLLWLIIEMYLVAIFLNLVTPCFKHASPQTNRARQVANPALAFVQSTTRVVPSHSQHGLCSFVFRPSIRLRSLDANMPPAQLWFTNQNRWSSKYVCYMD